jgi:hypothetical protein
VSILSAYVEQLSTEELERIVEAAEDFQARGMHKVESPLHQHTKKFMLENGIPEDSSTDWMWTSLLTTECYRALYRYYRNFIYRRAVMFDSYKEVLIILAVFVAVLAAWVAPLWVAIHFIVKFW